MALDVTFKSRSPYDQKSESKHMNQTQSSTANSKVGGSCKLDKANLIKVSIEVSC